MLLLDLNVPVCAFRRYARDHAAYRPALAPAVLTLD
jgi:hypothetical protein